MNICFFNVPELKNLAAPHGVVRATSSLAKEFCRRGYHVEFCDFTQPFRFYIPLVSALFPSLYKSERLAGVRFREFLKEHKIDIAIWRWGHWHIPFPLKDLPCKLVTIWCVAPIWSEQTCANKTVRSLKLRSHLAKRIIRSKLCRFLIWKFYEIYHSRFFFYALRRSEKFVFQSEEFFADFAPGEKFPQKVCAIPNIAPFEVQNVFFGEKRKELLFVGRMEMLMKQPDLLLHIWRKLQDHFPDWSLRFVGDGPNFEELKTLASSLGLKNVFFEGYQNPTPYYRSASIFCLTSAHEGFPNVLLEAQAYSCVPVAFDSFGSARDIIDDGENGYLVPPFDLDAYAEKLVQLMQDSELRERLANNAQESIAKFSAEAIGDKWEKLLKEVVGE